MKKIDLSILDNADDEIIDKLAPFSSDNETKKRVFSMSEKKFDKMINDRDRNNEYADSVSGVDVYRRPVWQKALCAAAAFAVIAGGIGATAYLMPKKGDSPDKLRAVQVEDGSEALAVLTTEELTTEFVSETSAPVVKQEAAVPLSNDEMKKLFDDSIEPYFEAVSLNSSERFDNSAESVEFWRYCGEYDADMDQGEDPDLKHEGDSAYKRCTYYKVKDPKFSTINELMDYYNTFMYKPEVQIGLGVDVSALEPGSIIPENRGNVNIIGYNGGIYANEYLQSGLPSENHGEVICDKPLYVTPTSFSWERIYKVPNADIGGNIVAEKAESVELDFEKMSDGSWKVTSCQVGGNEYDANMDYYKLTTIFSNWGGPYISDNMGINFSEAEKNIIGYITNNIDSRFSHYLLWERAASVPDNAKILTDEYVNDGNFLKFTYQEAHTDSPLTLDIYTDCNGKIFAVVE